MSLFNPIPLLRQNEALIRQLIRREVLLRYQGSTLGLAWAFLHPLLLLVVFTAIVTGVFGARWNAPLIASDGAGMALFIYCGLTVFFPFAEVLNAAPQLLHQHQNFIKKVMFPSATLPVILFASACMHSLAGFALLVLGANLAGAHHWTLLLLPVILLPAWIAALAGAWLLAALGVYIRDITQVMPVLMQLLMFVTPVLYPPSAAPDLVQALNHLNPLAGVIDDLRRIALLGELPDWWRWALALAGTSLAASAAFAFFQSNRGDFADAL